MKQSQLDYISKYYDTSNWLYRLFCYSPQSLGMHFGFWDESTKNRQQAIINENQSIIDYGNIRSDMKVLDAGCGVGGTAILIAQQTGAHVVGITINPTQVELAKKNAHRAGVDDFLRFEVQDYTNTTFSDQSFDLIYGIESICYASPKTDFLDEAFRLLKPGGKIIIADAYLRTYPKTEYQEKIVTEFIEAFALQELTHINEMTRQIKEIGFQNILFFDKTKNIFKSLIHYYQLAKTLRPLTSILSFIPIDRMKAMQRNSTALMKSYEGAVEQLCIYGIHIAQKPL